MPRHKSRSLSRTPRRAQWYKDKKKQAGNAAADVLSPARPQSCDSRRQERQHDRTQQRASLIDARRGIHLNSEATSPPQHDQGVGNVLDISNLNAAVESGKRLGAVKDVTLFCERDYPPSLRFNRLPGLFEADNVCSFCQAYRWKQERPGFCCGKGKIHLEPLPNLPNEMLTLYDVANPNFLDRLRSYNNALAFASLGCDEHYLAGFCPTFKIQGKVYHRFGSLQPEDGSSPKFAQIYFHDTDNEAQNRLRYNPHLDLGVLTSLQNCLHEVNPYVHSFKSALNFSNDHPDIKLVLKAEKKPAAEHPRRYNLPSSSEVAVIMPGDQASDLDVILHTNSGTIQRINSRHRSYDPLHYVLLFPFGTDGYSENLPRTTGKGNVTPSEFHRYRLQIRKDDSNYIMKSRRLTQQYATDAFVKVEAQRLRWVKNHQSDIRSEKYKCLLDAVDSGDERNAGTKVILPPTVYGSPRWYMESFQDAMAIVRKFGKPDYFITFTCNPNWSEITTSLFPKEKPSDRPDLCVRVFNLKLQSLLDDLTKQEVLGRVAAFTAMKEDQKRGLPHCHILLIMADESKPREPSDFDKVICAEIPDPVVNPTLYNIVTKNMIHGPCGPVNPSSPCMNTSVGGIKMCDKNFPKSFKPATVMTTAMYPDYRRRSPEDGGRTHIMKIKGQVFTADNRWIVPYNPFLTLRYNAHINVEGVISVKCVKYLYKYTCKGSDRVMVQLSNANPPEMRYDEVEQYVNARYVSASEAYWRLYEFKILHKYPSVAKLPLHLQDEQPVLFHADEACDRARQPPPKTKLTAFFELNASLPDRSQICYPDVFSLYTWKQNKWVKRSRDLRADQGNSHDQDALSNMIGRIPIIALNPHQSELYFLRMLLYHVPGPRSFQDLRTVNDEVLPTFQAACLKLGLLDDDSEIDAIINEAASVKFGRQLREVFATILIWVRPQDPLHFWKRHLPVLCQDLMWRDKAAEPTDFIINEVLLDIQEHFERNGYNMIDAQLPLPDPDLLPGFVPQEIREETQYDCNALNRTVQENMSRLNDEQLKVFTVIMDSVSKKRGKMIALDAAGGTGKTFVLTTILAAVRAERKVALATATSGIAATLLPNGRTLHSRCKVPVKNLDENSTCCISKRSATAEIFRKCELLVIDEVTMADRKVYEAVDRTLQDIRENNSHFGGVTVVFAGDWRQILPVVRKGSRADTVEACLKSSPLWHDVIIMKLTKNMRVQASGTFDTDFAADLLAIGEGKMPVVEELGEHKIILPPEYLLPSHHISDLCSFVFDGLIENHRTPDWLCSRAVLCPTNEAADEINMHMMSTFPGAMRNYRSADKLLGEEDNSYRYPTEFLNTICVSGMPPHLLQLKVGSPIMLLRNLDPARGHCNGTRYVITKMHDHVLEAVVATGVHAGTHIFIPRIPISPSDSLFPFTMQRRQFPVRPCFAMTANKAQGQTLSRIGIYLPKDFFSHGQLYVAVSRVGAKDNVRILTRNGAFPGYEATYTDNVVYCEILS